MLRCNCIFYVLIINCFCYAHSNFLNDDSPSYVTASVGDYVLLNCDIEFPQDIVIPYILSWKKEAKVIFNWYNGVITATEPYVGRVHLLHYPLPGYGKATINLTSIRESDAGWYECKVIFPNRDPSSRNNGTWIYLTVNGGNLLAVPPINQTVMEGDEVEFSCITKNRDTTVAWYKDSVPLTQLLDILHRSRIAMDGSLTISPTAMGDLGEYQCEATNPYGESQAARAFLNVQYKAKVIYTPKEVYLPYGRSAVLDCHFRSNPPLKSLRWEKDGFLFDPFNVPGVFYRQNGSLYFDKVDDSHNGYYSCIPENELGTEGPSPNIRVIVLRPPVFISTPQHIYLRKLGDTLSVSCDAIDGENGHKPNIVWYKKDGTALPAGRYSITGGNLTIINIHEEDRGLYQCSATNEAANIAAEMELLVENISPRAPYNLTGRATTNSIRIRWVAGRKRPRIKYSVWYRAAKSPEWRSIEIFYKAPLEATIYNLNPGREYEFMVLSQDPDGDALFSKPLRIWTRSFEDDTGRTMHSLAPIGLPSNVTIQRVDHGYLVRWFPPDYGLDLLSHYVLKWYDDTSGYISGTIETRDTAQIVSNIEEGKTYDFQVMAVTYNDYKATSAKVTITIAPYTKIRVVSMSLVVAVIIITVVVVAVYYAKIKWCKIYEKQTNSPAK